MSDRQTSAQPHRVGGRPGLRGLAALADRLPPWWNRALALALLVVGIAMPFGFGAASGFMNATIIAVAYSVMALGLNIVVGFAGLLDLGYVAFYALGAYSVGWFGSSFFFSARVHVLVSSSVSRSSASTSTSCSSWCPRPSCARSRA